MRAFIALFLLPCPFASAADTPTQAASTEYILAYRQGVIDAATDYTAKKPAMEVMGRRPANGYLPKQYLTRKYGITFRAVAGCMVTTGLQAHAAGYNSAMRDFLVQQYRRDIFAEAEDAVAIERERVEKTDPQIKFSLEEAKK